MKECKKLVEFQPDLGTFFNYVQEMIVLLPDFSKQQELYLAFEQLIETEKENLTKSINIYKSIFLLNLLDFN